MTSEHIIFIPAVLLAGIVIGYLLGLRNARIAYEKRRDRARM